MNPAIKVLRAKLPKDYDLDQPVTLNLMGSDVEAILALMYEYEKS